MGKVVIFAGTSDGRELAELLHRHQIPVHVCVATEYGEKVMSSELAEFVSAGRLTCEEMVDLIGKEEATEVVDATHPYAVAVSENIREACEKAGKPYLRMLRDSEGEEISKNSDCVCVESVDEAVEFLKKTPGKALLATGSKELAKYTQVEGFASRFTARVLSTPEVVASCQALGFEGKNLIAMQGPFSEELNTAMLKQTGAEWLGTKDSGKAGGFPEKVAAAKKAGAKLLLIRRPPENGGLTFAQVLEILCPEAAEEIKDIDVISSEPRKITLLGIGMGSEGQLTLDGIRACQKADVIIGARRMLTALEAFGKPTFQSYKNDEILHFIHKHPEYHRVVIALSGDVGFYSGARKLLDGMDESKVELICGISSVVYFCSRLRMAWEDVKLVSVHGRSANLAGAVRENAKVFSLVGGNGALSEICAMLTEYGLGDVTMWVGENLSYPDESIRKGTPREFQTEMSHGLCVILLENPEAGRHVVTHGIPDEAFLREKAPMTKEEVREGSLSKLRLTRRSVVYDVGAGTGSVSVEAARIAVEGEVYAIEKKLPAAELIRRNARKFGTTNLHVVEGLAPEAMVDLPVPTHAFIGGSSGNLSAICDLLRMKNPKVRIVVNAIALETIGELMEYLKEHPPLHLDIVQVSAAKSRTLGNYHMMTGMNPVLIASFDDDGDSESDIY